MSEPKPNDTDRRDPNPLRGYLVRKGKRVETLRVAVVFECGMAAVYPETGDQGSLGASDAG